MNLNNQPNQSYWFVLREDQSNVILSSNNFTIHNPNGQEASYIVDSGDRQFIQINEAPVALTNTVSPKEESPGSEHKSNEENNFWDKAKIKLFLTLCLANNFKHTMKDKELLEKIAAHLRTTSEDCSKKYKNLKRTFIRLLKKKAQGKEIKWVHYEMCEKVFSECKSLQHLPVLDPWDNDRIKKLLDLYILNLNRLRSPSNLKKFVWRDIASQLGTTDYICYHKFKGLKRTYFNRLQRSRATGKPVKWIFQQYFDKIYSNYTPTASTWDSTKTRQLIDAYLEIADKFRDPRYQKKDLWKEISLSVGERSHNCDKKFRNLKQTYLKLKMRADLGQSITKWRYYKDFERIYSPGSYWGSVNGKPESEDYIKRLLQFYLENKDQFRDPMKKKKQIWRQLAPNIGLTSEECDRKFRNLKQTYIRLAEKKRITGIPIRWPYYSYFEKIYEDRDPGGNRYGDMSDAAIYEVKKIMRQLQDRKDDERSKFERLVSAVEESNNIQRERNRIILALLDRK